MVPGPSGVRFGPAMRRPVRGISKARLTGRTYKKFQKVEVAYTAQLL